MEWMLPNKSLGRSKLIIRGLWGEGGRDVGARVYHSQLGGLRPVKLAHIVPNENDGFTHLFVIKIYI